MTTMMLQPARAHEDVPLPMTIHQTLDVPATCRVIVVGDVHGCFRELQDLLTSVGYDAACDRIVLVGDLVNKGPQSTEVLRFAQRDGVSAVRGNHDDAALAAYYRWKATGDESPPEKYAYVMNWTQSDVEFLSALPFTISIPAHNTIVVHAGLVPGIPLEQQKPFDMYKMRFVGPNPENPNALVAYEKKPSAGDDGIAAQGIRQWASVWEGPQHVIFGHDAKAGLQRESFATGLDTGCCYGRQLSACILPVYEKVLASLQHVPRVVVNGDEAHVKTTLDPSTVSAQWKAVNGTTISRFDPSTPTNKGFHYARVLQYEPPQPELSLETLRVIWSVESFDVSLPTPSATPLVSSVRTELLSTDNLRDRTRFAAAEPSLLVRTDAISYVMNNAVVVDVAVWDASCQPIWGFTRTLAVTSSAARAEGRDFSRSVLGDQLDALEITHRDMVTGNSLNIQMEKATSSSAGREAKTRVFVKQVVLEVDVAFLNQTFSTSYPTTTRKR
ncbi:hypothetical protein ATCC90586_002368 [Pythium insidiosum]|nr:hypothetical protein ATCC90586_002368 [Pythium insidiosum]